MRRIRKVERFRKYTYPLIFVFLFVSTIMIMGTPVTASSSSIIKDSAILPATDGEIVAFSTYEEDARQDLDGDGYLKSIVLRYYDIASGEIVNTGLRIGGWHANMPSIYGSIIVFNTQESNVAHDYNGDGDLNDYVIAYYDTDTGQVTYTGYLGGTPDISGTTIVFHTSEDDLKEDFDGNGEFDNYVIRYYDISSGNIVNTREFGMSPTISGDMIAFYTTENQYHRDLNDDGDMEDARPRYYHIPSGRTQDLNQIITPIYPVIVVPPYRPPGYYRVSISGSLMVYTDDWPIGMVWIYDIATMTFSAIDYGSYPSISGSIVAFTSYEDYARQDFNGDGDIDDYVLRYYDISSGTVESTRIEGLSSSVGGSTIAYQSCACTSSYVGYIDLAAPPTFPEISDDIDEYVIDGSIGNKGIASGLQETLEQAAAMIERGNTRAAYNILQSFINRVEAQAGQQITEEAAAALIESVRALIDTLGI